MLAQADLGVDYFGHSPRSVPGCDIAPGSRTIKGWLRRGEGLANHD